MSDRHDWYELCSEATPYPVESNSRQPLISHKQRYVAKYDLETKVFNKDRLRDAKQNFIYSDFHEIDDQKKKKKKIARTHLSIYEKSASMFSVCLLRHKRKQQLRHLMVAAAGSRPKRISGASQLLHPE